MAIRICVLATLLYISLGIIFSNSCYSQNVELHPPGVDATKPSQASNKIEPSFLFNGVPLNPKFPGDREYLEAIRKFPDLKSCTDKTGRDIESTQLKWRLSTKEADICLFYLFSAMQDIHKIDHWLQAQGFITSLGRADRNMRKQPSTENGWSIDAVHYTKHHGVLFSPNLIDTISQKMFSYCTSVVVVGSSSNDILMVSTTITYE